MWVLAPARTSENRDRMHRWSVSLAVALALHGGVVVAVLGWHHAVTSPSPPADVGPFVIDLAPASSRPIAAQTESQQPTAGGADADRLRPPEPSGSGRAPPAAQAGQNAAEKSTATGEQKGEQKTTPAEAALGVIAPPHLESAGREDSEYKRTASGGSGGGLAPAVPGGGSMSGPIDNRITIGSPFGWRAKNKAARPGAPVQKSKGFVLVRPSKGPGVAGSGRPANAGAPSAAINAIGEHVAVGAHIEDRVRAALARAVGKNAVGGAIPNLGGAAARTGERTVVNAIGATVRFRPRLPGMVGRAQPAGATAFTGNAGAVHANTLAAVNGTGMTHVGSGPGVIGGPARNLSGGINGTTFRLRRP